MNDPENDAHCFSTLLKFLIVLCSFGPSVNCPALPRRLFFTNSMFDLPHTTLQNMYFPTLNLVIVAQKVT